jgi:hypothetical protein
VLVRGRSGRLVATGCLLLAGLLAGCGGTAAPPLPGGPASPAPSQAPTATAAPGDPVLAGYLAYWDAVIQAHRAANPNYPALARHAAGAELTKVRNAISRNRQQDVSIRGTVKHQPRVASVSGPAAVVDDCYDVSGWNPVDLGNGQPIDAVDAGGTGRYRGRFTLRREAGGWLVISSTTSGGC